MKKSVLVILFSLFHLLVLAQIKPSRPVQIDDANPAAPTNFSNLSTQQGYPTANSAQPRKDTIAFEHRDDTKDAVAVSFKFLNELKKNNLDSSIDDFDKYYTVPSNYIYLGNNGAAAAPLIYQPNNNIGFDPGFHAFDIYKFSVDKTKFYKTNRPFTALNYQLASGSEQMLRATHLQNPRPGLGWGFDYKLINAPGFFITQNSNHNGYNVFSNYQGKKKRYNLLLSIVGNNIRASENGGIQNKEDLLDPNNKSRFTVPVNLGNNAGYNNNPFSTAIQTGNHYKDFNIFIRQSYDFGKVDSLEINDSTTEYLFYPKFRLQHTISFEKNEFNYIDFIADSSRYKNWYDLQFNKATDTINLKEDWKTVTNDFSILQFPDAKNQSQYFLAGVTLQNIAGSLNSGNKHYSNWWLHGEYRNRTKNKRWDILIKGAFYSIGLNSGDYSINASLNRYLGKNGANVNIFFTNSNRTPSFVFNEASSFNFNGPNQFKKENITSFGAQSASRIIDISIKNSLIVNHTYFKNYYQAVQFSKPINLLQINGAKKFQLKKHLYNYTEVTMQQVDGASPIRVPLLFMRNRLAIEGLFFKNLNLSTGIEMRYYTPYKANGYSPLLGQFFKQDVVTIKNLPDVNAYINFRIKGFTGYLRAENLNTMSFKNGFGFINNNFAAPFYPTQGMMIRFGIKWWFVN